MPFVLDKFANLLEDTKEILYQMFLRKAFNDKHNITESEARFIATRKLRFWLKRISCAMTKTKAMSMCISISISIICKYIILIGS